MLHVLQSRDGGTARQVRALIGASRARYRHYVAIAVGDDWRIEEALDGDAVLAFDFRRLPDESWPAFLGGIAATFRIDLVHLHNISRCRDGLIDALAGLDLPLRLHGARPRFRVPDDHVSGGRRRCIAAR